MIAVGQWTKYYVLFLNFVRFDRLFVCFVFNSNSFDQLNDLSFTDKMGSSGSKSSSGSSGCGEWKNQIYFDPESDSANGNHYFISDNELKEKLSQLINTQERIEKIWIFSHRLYEWQLYQGMMMYHAFVVLETNEWYWSIEKNNEGITIQRSKNWSYVKGKYRRKSRITPITQRNHDEGRMKMEDLIDWLYQKNELNKRYNIQCQDGTCQGFAKRVFNHFARKKLCNPLLY